MKETELQNQTIDLIWNGYTKTSERAEKFIHTTLHDERPSTCFFKRKNIATASDMQGKILGFKTALLAMMASKVSLTF